MEFIAYQVMLACATILMIMGTIRLTYAFVCATRDFMGRTND
jgi:hypothetical protein|nr:MAG TPA_asm: hypothetical protein [Caudoviricetes sp.]